MKLAVGMYVRTKWGINKINEYVPKSGQLYLKTDVCHKSNVIKASHNIIDLIEVGDYVNGGQVREKTNEYIRISGGKSLWEYLEKEQDIETIVTKEQFEAMQYKVVEE